MTRYTSLRLLMLALAALFIFASCSSSSNSDGNPVGGTGGGREFASGDLNTGQSFTHVFKTAKTVRYYCRPHGGPGGVGMAGVITVMAGGTPSSHSFSITNFTLPSFTIDVNDTVTWTNNGGVTHTVESDN